MSFKNAVIPFFAEAPSEYSRSYTSQITRSFSIYAQQIQNPGPIQAEALSLTGLSIYANNAAAITGGLVENDVYKTATGELRIVV